MKFFLCILCFAIPIIATAQQTQQSLITPVPIASAQISPLINPVSQEQLFRIEISITIPEGLHQLNQQEFFGFELSNPQPEWSIGAVQYPETPNLIEGIPSYEGSIILYRNVDFANADPPAQLQLMLKYQLCNDTGLCFRPGAIPIVIATGTAAGVETAPMENSLFGILLMAFLGGLILNLMPCVLPVLSIKLLTLSKQSGMDPHQRHRQSAFTVSGIIFSMLVLALILIILQASGKAAGWGIQFQSPMYGWSLMVLLFSFALNLLGVWSIPSFRVKTDAQVSKGSSNTASFFNGILTVVLATPCSAPFLGVALGFALSSTWWVILLVFLMIGIGLASPFYLIANIPRAVALLPKPGVWMDRFKELLAFGLLGTAVWLVTLLSRQIDQAAFDLVLWFMVVLGIFWWLVGKMQASNLLDFQKKILLGLSFGIVLGCALFMAPAPFRIQNHVDTLVDSKQDKNWQTFSGSTVQASLEQGKPVFIAFSAAWCLTCQLNEATTLQDAKVLSAFKNNNVQLFKADWTNPNSEIEHWLARFRRNAVPLYVFLSKNQKPQILPEVLYVHDILNLFRPL